MSQSGMLNIKGSGGPGSPILSLTGDTGGPVFPAANNVNVFGQPQAGSSVTFSGATPTLSLNTTDATQNVLIGQTAGNNTHTGFDNVGVGYGSLNALTSGIRNAGLGYQTLNTLQSGNFNVAVGYNALLTDLSGSSNTAVGTQALTSVNTGNFNTALGYQAGQNYTTSESSNIVIANSGVLGESNTLRIGVTGSGTEAVNRCFIAGIRGVNVGSVATVVTEASDQLGTAVITAGTGITVTTGANTITIASTAVTAWTDEGISFNAAVNNGYFTTAAITATLPPSPSQGDTIMFVVDTASQLTIQANTGQVIRNGASASSAAGTAKSNAQGDSLTLTYRASDTTWLSRSSIGIWTMA